MLNKKKTHNTIRVALKLPPRVADFIIRAQAVHDQLALNSKTLPAPNPVLTVLQSQVDDLKAKETLAKSRVPGAPADRDAAKKLVRTSLNSERAYVEQVANADPENAQNIAEDAGMSLRPVPAHAKPPLAAKAGKVSGTVTLAAKAVKGAKGNQWQYSTDGGKTWVDLPQTTKSSTTLTSLTPGTTVTFRHRVFSKAGVSDWGDPIAHLVT